MTLAFWVIVVASLLSPSAGARGSPDLKSALPWYHTSDEVHQILQDLQSSCQGASVSLSSRTKRDSKTGDDVSLDILHVDTGAGADATRVMLVFGEHARELITVESGLDFVQTLCGAGNNAKRAGHVLDKVKFTIVPNANPLSRQQVEEGDACKRTDEAGVDINRNWGDKHHEKAVPGDENNPGPSGFSEPATQLLRDFVTEEKPDVFVSVHSGAKLLGMPWGYSQDGPPPHNMQAMMEVLEKISQKYCQGDCPYGSLAKTVGYKSAGTDIDYVSEMVGTPYVFTWEIYAGDYERGTSKSFLQDTGARLRRNLPEASEDPAGCSAEFNPQTKAETKSVIENWTGAYLELAELVAARKGGR
eukprot:gnl/MRDRNA2_/MRDRNA2_84074_c0_seq1.p1 gnl/MRDRNA2_/MRDRNA2_84074_c0~~gnl/MRDRNA2_/MRDRNA2_84074_c0_seq1.p1  ORF type:complete len:360 (+),score=59.51 gnl/MRDRNA2_/MRDRNA2_84074_c0_seq1:17-1096(+)